jgi:dTDP-4-amino-4,6-dideoxygalactose transaminase
VANAVAVNSGTSGLHLAVKAAGLGPDDEVITTPFSFVASANCLLYEGAIPRFVDIDPDSYNIDVRQIPGAITGRTRAILPVHIFGRPCPMQDIMEIARGEGLVVIEDACEALGATYRGKAVGSFGQTSVFAFYPNKQITTGEGGIITTDNPQVACLCRSWRNQGRAENDAWLEHARLGYNYRLSDLNCALGLAQLSRLDEILARRARVAGRYTEILLDRLPQVIPPAPAATQTSISWFVYTVRLCEEFSRQDRDAVIADLCAAGIGCRNYFSPIHLQPFYRERFGFAPGDFPVAEHVSERIIALPFFSQLSDKDIVTVCDALARAVARQKSFTVAVL